MTHVLFDRIRSALGRTAGANVPPPPPIEILRTCAAAANLIEHFTTKAREVGCRVDIIDEEQLRPIVSRLIGAQNAGRAVLSLSDDGLRDPLAEIVRAAGVEIIECQPEARATALFDSDVAITDVDAAVAETGTLVFRSGPHRPRAVHVIAPVHLAIVREHQIVPDLVDLFPGVASAAPTASATVLVTGPSKTADIEGIMVTGVHGPGIVHILVIPSRSPESEHTKSK